MSRRYPCFLACGVGLLVLVGCQPATGSITGKVSYQGKALPVGNITFVVAERPPASAQIRDGAFSIDKVPTGEAKIAITAPAPPAKGPAGPKGAPKDKGGGPTKAVLPSGVDYGGREEINTLKIPDHYADLEKSGLKHTVVSGKQEFNVDLQDRK